MKKQVSSSRAPALRAAIDALRRGESANAPGSIREAVDEAARKKRKTEPKERPKGPK